MVSEMNKPGNQVIQYELTITPQEAASGLQKILTRNEKRLQVNIPARVVNGSLVKLANALQVTDNQAGDIIIKIVIKSETADSESSAQGRVVEINDNSFESEVVKSELPVVVDFWAPWCGPCRMMAPVMDKASTKYAGKFKFCKINVDENPESASRYQAMSIPLLMFFKNGQIVDKNVGAIPESRLITILDALL
jgi:thioredoxin 1